MCGRLSFICPRRCRRGIAVYPPPRASNPYSTVYLTLQLAGDAARGVTIAPGGLLPHLFTLTRQCARRLFSVTLPHSHPWLPVKKCDALCCPDFPLDTRCQVTSDKPPHCIRPAKLLQVERKTKFIWFLPKRRVTSTIVNITARRVQYKMKKHNFSIFQNYGLI